MNSSSILYRFRDKARYWFKIAILSCLLLHINPKGKRFRPVLTVSFTTETDPLPTIQVAFRFWIESCALHSCSIRALCPRYTYQKSAPKTRTTKLVP